MLQVARLSPNLLGDSRDLIRQFLTSQQVPGGGFADRDGNSDLYYTVFGIESFRARREEPPLQETGAWLRRFGGGEELDFVHLTCLGRCWANVARGDLRQAPRESILERLERFRSG